jgi:hypothetical protein
MKKNISLLLALFSLSFCTQTQNKVEKIMEDGVEVIVNHLEPYKINGELTTLTLKEEFTIDLEKEDIAAIGLTDIWGFDVNSEGDIYLFRPPTSQGDMVFRFDQKGNFISSFARRGQGPGEVENLSYQKVNKQDELPITNPGKSEIMIFNKDGHLIKEIPIGLNIGFMGNMVYPLENGNYLIRRSISSPSGGRLGFALNLFNPDFKKIREFDRFEVVQPMRAAKVRLPMHVSVWCVSNENIYVGNEERGYEICVYDFDGNLLRKIRKNYEVDSGAGKLEHEIREKLKYSPQVLKDKIYFPERCPPFQFIFTDDEARLYVMTFKEGKNPNENIFDIFNPDGIFIATVSMHVSLNDPFFTPGAPLDSWVTIKKNRLYSLREKSNGYREFVVYKTIWN